MKTFKKFLNESGGYTGGGHGGENPNNLAGEVTDTLGSDLFNSQNLKRINHNKKEATWQKNILM